MGRRASACLGFAAAALVAFAPCASAQQGLGVLPDLLAPLALLRTEPPEPTSAVAAAPENFKPPEISPNTGMPKFDAAQEGGNIGNVQLAIESSQYADPRYLANSEHPDDMGLWEGLGKHYRPEVRALVEDYKNFYLSENILWVGAAVAIAAPLANTRGDQEIRNWYQRGAGNGKSIAADRAANACNDVGNVIYAVPVLGACSLTGFIWDDNATLTTIGQFGNRSVRALLVGAPTVGALQYGLGAGQPADPSDSRWQPLQGSNSVSTNAFVGAVPFLTAASMTDSIALKTLFVAGSFGPAWADFHCDNHYFSQVFLGWSIAYLSVHSVNLTEADSRFRIVPVDVPKGVGVGVQVEY